MDWIEEVITDWDVEYRRARFHRDIDDEHIKFLEWIDFAVGSVVNSFHLAFGFGERRDLIPSISLVNTRLDRTLIKLNRLVPYGRFVGRVRNLSDGWRAYVRRIDHMVLRRDEGPWLHTVGLGASGLAGV